MSIAFDATGTGNASSNTLTFAHTCTGTDLILMVGVVLQDTNNDRVSGVTYAGVAMTRTAQRTGQGTASGYLYYLVNPSTGANNVIITLSQVQAIQGRSVSYTAAKQTGQMDSANNGGNPSAAATLTLSTTVVASNCWLVGVGYNLGGDFSAGTGTTLRGAASSIQMFDSNGVVGTGSQSLIVDHANAEDGGCIASIAPAIYTSIKTINGLPYELVKTINGLPVNSVQSINGLP